MKTLVVGASGATGKQLVEQLLKLGGEVKVIVRSPDALPTSWKHNAKITIIKGSVLDLTENEIEEHLIGCDAVASCLGHNMTWKGIYGQPRKLVTDTAQRVCSAIKKMAPETPVKFVLMNTAGNRNRDLNEPITFGERLMTVLFRLLLPPHVDNEMAADYLRTKIGQNDSHIQWVTVRPDSLINEEHTSDYEAHPSPIRSALFNPGKTSRTNVGHFMASLINDDTLWQKWKGQMPVIYNIEV